MLWLCWIGYVIFYLSKQLVPCVGYDVWEMKKVTDKPSPSGQQWSKTDTINRFKLVPSEHHQHTSWYDYLQQYLPCIVVYFWYNSIRSLTYLIFGVKYRFKILILTFGEIGMHNEVYLYCMYYQRKDNLTCRWHGFLYYNTCTYLNNVHVL